MVSNFFKVFFKYLYNAEPQIMKSYIIRCTTWHFQDAVRPIKGRIHFENYVFIWSYRKSRNTGRTVLQCTRSLNVFYFILIIKNPTFRYIHHGFSSIAGTFTYNVVEALSYQTSASAIRISTNAGDAVNAMCNILASFSTATFPSLIVCLCLALKLTAASKEGRVVQNTDR